MNEIKQQHLNPRVLQETRCNIEKHAANSRRLRSFMFALLQTANREQYAV